MMYAYVNTNGLGACNRYGYVFLGHGITIEEAKAMAIASLDDSDLPYSVDGYDVYDGDMLLDIFMISEDIYQDLESFRLWEIDLNGCQKVFL